MRGEGDAFVSQQAVQASFQHLRDYMDYHSDRFPDYSLVAREHGRIVAVLPACRLGSELWSHAGLTYGGWLTEARHIDANIMLELWQQMTGALQADGITAVHYKPAPAIYAAYPADEDRYALFRAGAVIEASQVASVIDLQSPIPYNENMRRNARKALKAGITIAPSHDYGGYWQLLSGVLAERHGAAPVHTLAEITMLADRFPHNIGLLTATDAGGCMIAGVVTYATAGRVMRSQYIAANDRGCDCGALALLFEHLIADSIRDGYRYLDFGTSNEQGGLILNAGLLRQKAAMGGRAVACESYRLCIAPR